MCCKVSPVHRKSNIKIQFHYTYLQINDLSHRKCMFWLHATPQYGLNLPLLLKLRRHNHLKVCHLSPLLAKMSYWLHSTTHASTCLRTQPHATSFPSTHTHTRTPLLHTHAHTHLSCIHHHVLMEGLAASHWLVAKLELVHTQTHTRTYTHTHLSCIHRHILMEGLAACHRLVAKLELVHTQTHTRTHTPLLHPPPHLDGRACSVPLACSQT